jgi:hypothetical protein
MATPFQPGDYVAVTARDQTAADIKSGLYYPHYGGLQGTILKVYGDEISVQVDRTTLSNAMRTRHEDNEKAMRQRWLDGLSEEARTKLSAGDKAFTLGYALLVAAADLRPAVRAERATSADLDAAEAAFLASRNGH